MSPRTYATPLRIAQPGDAEAPAVRSARLYAEARDAARQTVDEALLSLSAAEGKLTDLAGLQAAPAGARDLARRMAEQMAADARNLASLIGGA